MQTLAGVVSYYTPAVESIPRWGKAHLKTPQTTIKHADNALQYVWPCY